MQRRLDIANLENYRAVKVKSGNYFSMNKDVRCEIQGDERLVIDGWDIEWHIEC